MRFNVYINNLEDGAECSLISFADDTEIGGLADTLEAWAAIQRDLRMLEKFAISNLMKFNKWKQKAALHKWLWGSLWATS